jgi:acyl transferase domain-containing protein
MSVRQLAEANNNLDHVGEIAEEYWDTIRDIKPRDPLIPFYSSLYETQILDGRDLGPTYWRLNGESPVLFNSAVAAVVRSNPRPKVFLEIGPHAALAGPLRQIMKAMQLPFQYTPTLQRNSNGTDSLLEGVGNLYLRGLAVDFAKMHCGLRVLTDLPTYPWNYSAATFWSEPRMSKEWRLPKHSRHDLLGSRVTATNELGPSWRNLLSIDNVPWIRDHVVQGNVVFPFAGYVAVAAAAIQQVTEADGPIALRHIVVRQALVMYEGRCEELSTTFRHLRLTDKLYSDWWEFDIASHAGDSGTGNWISHCTGEVRVMGSTDSSSSTIDALPRNVDSSYWYKMMARTGLGYGPEFRGLDEISTDPTSNKAHCSVGYVERTQGSSYQIHPCELDKCLQSIFVAMSRGLGRRFPRAMVPTTIGEVIMGKQNGMLQLETIAEIEAGRGDIVGNITGYDQGKTVLQVKGLRASVLEALTDKQEDLGTGGRITWMPDIRFLDLAKLIHPPPDRRELMVQLEKLNLLYIVDVVARLQPDHCPTGYLAKHFKWLFNQYEAIKNGHSAVVLDCQALVEMSEEARRNSLVCLRKAMSQTDARAPAAAVSRAFEIVEDVFARKVEAVEGLFRDDTLADLYRFMDFRYCKDFFRCLAHNRPAMRILEIGSGTGGATQVVMESLLSSNGQRMYNSYTFTDVSAGFFAAAKDKLQKYSGIKYQVLDISQDPIDQGFTEGYYDLVIAANVSV